MFHLASGILIIRLITVVRDSGRLLFWSWLPCVADVDIIFKVALWNRADHYIFIEVGDWMSTMLPHTVWPSANLECRSEMCCTRLAENTGRKNNAKNRHLQGTIPQLCWAISSQLRHLSTIRKSC